MLGEPGSCCAICEQYHARGIARRLYDPWRGLTQRAIAPRRAHLLNHTRAGNAAAQRSGSAGPECL